MSIGHTVLALQQAAPGFVAAPGEQVFLTSEGPEHSPLSRVWGGHCDL
jgi:hypothetical protein